MWLKDAPQGNEAGKIVWELVPYTRGTVLDLGCGPSKAFPHFIGVDSGADEKLFGVQMNPDIRIPDCAKLDLFASQSVDAVFSSHLLEHIEDYRAALKEWWRVIKPGGYLCLYLPHKELYPNVGTEGANPDHKHDFMPDDIIDAMRAFGGWDLVRNEDRNKNIEYSFFQVYQKTSGKEQRYSYRDEKPAKTAAVIRYGAIGDVLQASSILPHLKEQGYHVTFYTVPGGYEVMKNDPHIDRFIVQGENQVPNHHLGDFWKWEARKYDRFINLSESVEATWLAVPDKTFHSWPDSVRKKYLDRNYMEFVHDLAEVPHGSRVKFYPTAEEKAWARKEYARLGPCVLYALSGSSVHKAWPWMDNLIARILVKTDLKIVTTGGEIERILEQGWENEARVINRAGKWSIRQVLAFAEHCEMVIGPETGVLNAVSMLPMPKIVFLSHSSHQNLTRDWVNTCALEPKDTPCYPCHRMHYTWEHCKQDEATGTALCQVNIDLERAWSAVESKLRKAA